MKTNYGILLFRKQKASTITLVILIIMLFFGFRLFKHQPGPQKRKSTIVKTAKVVNKKNVRTLAAIGTIKAAQGINVSSPVASIAQSIHFQSGQFVNAGDILLTLKNDDLKALVKESNAKYQLAQMNAKRGDQLVGKGYISKQNHDLDQSNIQETQARLELAEAQLANTIIKAPFSGTLGISQVHLGQFISTGQVIVSLQDNSKLYVEFTIPEKNSDLIQVDTPLIASASQSEQHQWKGKIIAVDAELDNNTRSLPVRAELLPPYESLKPGMFVNVHISLPNALQKPAVSQNAIVYNPYGNFVYLYKKGIVIQRYVDLGQTLGKDIIIESGLSAGEIVVIEGQQKLYDGAKVQVQG